jgi:hypothetical protein
MKRTLSVLTAVMVSLLTGCAAQVSVAQHPEHPYYLRALSDLRAARWLIEHRPGNPMVRDDENVAIAEIDATINEIKRAAIVDGKDTRDHPPVDETPDRNGRLHHAKDLLNQVYSDIARDEDDPITRGIRDQALHHLDEAIHATQRALQDANRGA